MTHDDADPPLVWVKIDKTAAHRAVQGRGGELVIMYETCRQGAMRSSLERETDLKRFRRNTVIPYLIRRVCPLENATETPNIATGE